MSQYRGGIPAAPFDDQYYDHYDDRIAPPHRGGEYYVDDDQYYSNGYTHPSPLQMVRTSSTSSYSPRRRPHPATLRYAGIDDVADEYYYLSPEYQPPRRRAEFSDGRLCYRDGYSDHPIQTVSSFYSRPPPRPRSPPPPPPLGDVVSMEVARGLQRIIPSLVDVGIAKFKQMAISMRRETQRPEVRATDETNNRQVENEEARQENIQDVNRERDETDESINVNSDP